jgi:chromosome segregation ATPase
MTAPVILDREAIRDKFREWDEVQQPLDVELSESLAALAAFQSHLEGWQQELAREREELRAERARLGHDQSSSESSQKLLNELTAELEGSREKSGQLSAMLLSRTEELRVLDGRRAELATELELAQIREKELKTALDETRKNLEQERSEAAAETQRLRELLESKVESENVSNAEDRATAAPVERQPSERPSESRPAENPVLASVMEQFGKLRQQRASERPALKKGR